MKKLNKKGFTLVELLAVIVVLAIIMVIATQQVGKAMNNSRANAFVESYQMVIKQVNTYLADAEDPVCNQTTGDENYCLTKYNLSSDYRLIVVKATNFYHINLRPNTTDGKFKNVNLTKYGKYTNDTNTACSKEKIGSEVVRCTATMILGRINY